jgi:hypothetical protein
MSALLPKADIAEREWNVRFVPLAEVRPFKIGASSSGNVSANRIDDYAHSCGPLDAPD